MAFLTLTFDSKYVGRTAVSIIFPGDLRFRATPDRLPKGIATNPPPESHEEKSGEPELYQCLWLFHGGGGNASHWPLDSTISPLVAPYKLVVVMPTLSDYTATLPEIGDYFAYITEELPSFLRTVMPISDKREDNFISGFSYGGYYAMRVGMTYPERYGCVCSTGAPVDLYEDLVRHHAGQDGSIPPEEFPGSEKDVLHLAERNVKEGRPLPRIFQGVGYDDFTWDFNITARDKFRALGYDHTWVNYPGPHNYAACQLGMENMMQWLPLKKQPRRGPMGGPGREKK